MYACRGTWVGIGASATTCSLSAGARQALRAAFLLLRRWQALKTCLPAWCHAAAGGIMGDGGWNGRNISMGAMLSAADGNACFPSP